MRVKVRQLAIGPRGHQRGHGLEGREKWRSGWDHPRRPGAAAAPLTFLAAAGTCRTAPLGGGGSSAQRVQRFCAASNVCGAMAVAEARAAGASARPGSTTASALGKKPWIFSAMLSPEGPKLPAGAPV